MVVRIVKRGNKMCVEDNGTVLFPNGIAATPCTIVSHTQIEHTRHGIIKRIVRDIDDSEEM